MALVHGGIDGYSRLVKCSPNNRADTVFTLFITACNNLGIPSRVRSDRGGENVLVAIPSWFFIVALAGGATSLVPVHNQRIERLWRDLYTASISLFYHLFYFLEDAGLLDLENDIHLYSLPRINLSLQTTMTTKFLRDFCHWPYRCLFPHS